MPVDTREILMTVYMLNVWHAPMDEADFNADEMQATSDAVDKFNQKIVANGNWVFGGGLLPFDTATVVRQDGLVTDGPFLETKENLGGFWIIRAKNLDEAMALAKEASVACQNDVEVRPFQPDTDDLAS